MNIQAYKLFNEALNALVFLYKMASYSLVRKKLKEENFEVFFRKEKGDNKNDT